MCNNTYRWPVNTAALEAKAATMADLVESLEANDYAVPGAHDWHVVTIEGYDWADWRCTCDWQKSHGATDAGGRGCSHVRAVRMFLDAVVLAKAA